MSHRIRQSGLTAVVALVAALAAVVAGLLAFSPASTARPAADVSVASAPVALPDTAAKGAKPTVVLVHGAFADSSGWSEVAMQLKKEGYRVLAFSNPLRGPGSDSEYLRQFLSTIPGPVVLVGHSYGGMVITNAATGNANVKALVYIAAYAPAEGESVAQANSLGGGHTDVVDNLVIRPYPGAAAGDADAYINPKKFHQLFAQDLPRKEAAFMAASQRPGALGSLVTPSGTPAWKSIPSYYMVTTKDRIIPPQAERAMAKRAGAYTVVVKSSHVVMMSHPGKVTRLILRAAR